MQQLSELVSDLQRRLAAGDKVYLHCWGGRGRAGTVGACLLAQMYGLSADEALERVQRAFDTRRDNERLSPETDEQRQLVRAFVAQLGR
ncbi:MAP kinase phosphatase 6 [Monoraphidium neglectum]|uniref:MAP kinase phosphatase 6 n=1 Tax=Monoraphidium neglectum TaxID=145388 RepID=A0A0D2LTR3_9CHLO|nr:MAP kinase phosphatase 6 [Monoraphidium neglectum]KIY95054.1 MAP kinase phosphatase 6 [Monoraphidium neglectum]|eukprot:XP_013894074.1 MAP kinase phosphatase 6 [Monoraphidium neglectum]